MADKKTNDPPMVITSLVESSNTNWGNNGFLLTTNSTNGLHINLTCLI